MMGDLKQIRRFSSLLQKTEINFDLLSAVDELATQVKLEFEFRREAKVMDTIADNLKVCMSLSCRLSLHPLNGFCLLACVKESSEHGAKASARSLEG